MFSTLTPYQTVYKQDPVRWVSSPLGDGALAAQQLCRLTHSHLLIFPSVDCAFGVMSKKPLPGPISRSFSAVFLQGLHSLGSGVNVFNVCWVDSCARCARRALRVVGTLRRPVDCECVVLRRGSPVCPGGPVSVSLPGPRCLVTVVCGAL